MRVKKLIVAVVSRALTSFTHNNLNSSLGGCCPVIVMFQVSCAVVTITEAQPVDELLATGQFVLPSSCYSIPGVELEDTANPYIFAFFHSVD